LLQKDKRKNKLSLQNITAKAKVTSSTIVSAIFLLLGVLVMAYGFYYNSLHFTYVGIFITGAMTWTISIITITRKCNRT